MSIEIQCPACGKRLRAPESQAGKAGKCPACKADFMIPAVRPAAAAPTTAAATRPAVPNPVAPPPPAPSAGPAASGDIAPAAVQLPPAPTFTTEQFEPLFTDRSAAAAQHSAQHKPVAVTITVHNWVVLRTALTLTNYSLLAEWIACCVFSLGMVLLAVMFTLAQPSATGVQLVTVLMIWGGAGMLIGWMVTVSGWIVCLLDWPEQQSRRWLWGSVGAVAAATVLVLLYMSYQIFAASSGPPRMGHTTSSFGSGTILAMILGAAFGGSLILFNFFLADIESILSGVSNRKSAIVYAAVVGGLTVWCLVFNIAIQPTGTVATWILVISNSGTLITEFVWLWLKNRRVLATLAGFDLSGGS